MKVFVDVETDGLVDWNKPWTDACQPHILSVGAVAFTDDGSDEIFSHYSIVKPENYVIDDNCEAVKVNGITQATAMAFGIKYRAAVTPLSHICNMASEIIIFNAQFEAAMFEIERQRFQLNYEMIPRVKARCLMLNMARIIGEPGLYQGQYKWPKFHNAYKHIFGVEPENQHHAMHDARQSAWLAFEVVKQGLWDWS